MRARRQLICLLVLAAACAVGGCSVARRLVSPNATPGGPQPLVEGAAPTADDSGCVPLEGEAVITRPDDGFCLAYLMRFHLTQNAPAGLTIQGQPLDQSADPVRATFELTVKPTSDDLASAAADEAAEFKDFTAWVVRRADVTLGGVPAVQFEPVPGRLSGRLLVAVSNGRLYRLYFWPVDLDAAAPDIDALYGGIVRSWRFLPQDAGS